MPCAVGELCNLKEGDMSKGTQHRCPGCKKPMHAICGFSNVRNTGISDSNICFSCGLGSYEDHVLPSDVQKFLRDHHDYEKKQAAKGSGSDIGVASTAQKKTVKKTARQKIFPPAGRKKAPPSVATAKKAPPSVATAKKAPPVVATAKNDDLAEDDSKHIPSKKRRNKKNKIKAIKVSATEDSFLNHTVAFCLDGPKRAELLPPSLSPFIINQNTVSVMAPNAV